MPTRLIRFETHAGAPVKSGETRLIPFTKALIIQFPGFPGGLVWNRPVSVLAISPNGEEQLLPIEDKTRQLQISLFASAVASIAILSAILAIINKKKEK